MSDVPDISLNLMRKRRRKTLFRLRRRRYICSKISLEEAPGVEEITPEPHKKEAVPQQGDSAEWEEIRRGLFEKVKSLEGDVRRADSRSKAADERAALLETEVVALRDSLKRAEERFDGAKKVVDESRAQVQRARADMDSQRKRLQRERDDLREFAAEGILRELLPILDNFSLALQNADNGGDPAVLLQGFRMIQREMTAIMDQAGLKKIEAEGHPFDPRIHDAASTGQEPGRPDGVVLRDLRPGYMFKTKVLRPTMVAVNKLSNTPITELRDLTPAPNETDSDPVTPAGSQPTPPPGASITPRPITPRRLTALDGRPTAPPPVRTPIPQDDNQTEPTRGQPSLGSPPITPSEVSETFNDTNF